MMKGWVGSRHGMLDIFPLTDAAETDLAASVKGIRKG